MLELELIYLSLSLGRRPILQLKHRKEEKREGVYPCVWDCNVWIIHLFMGLNAALEFLVLIVCWLYDPDIMAIVLLGGARAAKARWSVAWSAILYAQGLYGLPISSTVELIFSFPSRLFSDLFLIFQFYFWPTVGFLELIWAQVFLELLLFQQVFFQFIKFSLLLMFYSRKFSSCVVCEQTCCKGRLYCFLWGWMPLVSAFVFYVTTHRLLN